MSSHSTAHDINSSSYANMTAHHHHMDSSCYGITSSPYISPIPVWYHIITIRFIHPCMASFCHFIYPCMASFCHFIYPCTISLPHCTHQLLLPSSPFWMASTISYPAPSLQGITSCPIIMGNHILPHHYRESHHAPSVQGSFTTVLGLINCFNLLVRPQLYIH
jgi:hypothetical protein